MEMCAVTSHDADTDQSYWLWKGPIFILILVIGFALRLYLASVTVYLWDEDRDWIVIAEKISLQRGNFYLPIHDGQHPSFPAYFIKSGSILLGDNPIGFRFFSLLAGISTIILAFRLALEWTNPIVACWTAALLAFNEYHIAVSILTTEKSFYLLFGMLALYTFSRFLRTQKPQYLYLSGITVGCGFLCKYIITLFIPVFFAILLFPKYRHWLRRREPYIALLFFIIVITPDLYWNLTRQPTEGSQAATIGDHFSRVGKLGFNRHYILFYGRDVVRAIYSFVGWELGDNAEEYPTMNPLFGVILLGGVLIVTFQNKQHDHILKFLVLLFWTIFGFFTLLRPGTPSRNLDPVVWFWVDLTLLAAVLLVGYYLSRLQGKWRLLSYATTGAAALYATVGVLVFHLGMPWFNVELRPEFLWPPTGNMVEVRAKFHFCAACDADPKIELLDIVHKNATHAERADASDLEGVEWNTADRVFRLRAALDPGGGRRRYIVIYRITDNSGRVGHVRYRVDVPQETPRVFPEPFWARN